MNLLDVIIPLVIGSLSAIFANYLSDLLPRSRKFTSPFCTSCQAKNNWGDYFLLRRCQSCKKNRSLRTWVIQVFFPVISLLIWFFPRPILPYSLAIGLLALFTLIFVIDLEHRLVLHPVMLFSAIIGLGVGIFLRGQDNIVHGLISTLFGGLGGYGIMLALYYFGVLFARYLSRKKGLPPDEVALGYGDVNLAGVLGLMLGWPGISYCLLLAIMAGGIISLFVILVTLALKRYKAFTAIPYAPFLILAATYILFS